MELDSNLRLESPRCRYRFGAAEFDEARLELRVGGRVVELEQKPLRILAELVRHADEAVTRSEISESVWNGVPVVEHALTNAVAKLRKALGDGEDGRILTLPRIGYRLVGPVERIAITQRQPSRFEFRAGAAVPGRENWVLQTLLSVTQTSEVWQAEHAKTKDVRVFKFCLDGDGLHTLKRETTLYRVLRECLGERADIVTIFDWNFETPPFYLECAHAGENLLQWAACDDHLAALSREQRLGLFLQIGETVAAAHSVGVLHKDLKPANILIHRHAGGWQARVSDFGSGRLLEPGRLAELGITQLETMEGTAARSEANSGTPLYLAPELIAGQSPTVQSDVYALGVILYQLVIGDLRTPMASGWEAEIGDELLATDIAAATDRNPARRLTRVGELVNRLRNLDRRRSQQHAARTAELRMAAALAAAQRAKARRPWLTRLSGFDREKGGFQIFLGDKYLILAACGYQNWPKMAVVKT